MDSKAMNMGMMDALEHSKSQDAMARTAKMMMDTAKMLQAGHLDPMLLMKTMDQMQSIMPPDQSDQSGQGPDQNQNSGMGMGA